jgi:hypothetical protein
MRPAGGLCLAGIFRPWLLEKQIEKVLSLRGSSRSCAKSKYRRDDEPIVESRPLRHAASFSPRMIFPPIGCMGKQGAPAAKAAITTKFCFGNLVASQF